MVGPSQPRGQRWFQHAGGMAPIRLDPMSGGCLSFLDSVATKRLTGQNAVSVNRANSFFTPVSMLPSMAFSEPIVFVFTYSMGLYSSVSTCFRETACAT